jgi:hypothetical protein
MKFDRVVRVRSAGRVSVICFLVAIVSGRAGAQSQPRTIPTVVAQAMGLQLPFFGPPQYYDGRTPPTWPADLVPAGARVLGGGIMGDSAMFRMQVAVFEFSGADDPPNALRNLVSRAGYATVRRQQGTVSGFVPTEMPAIPVRYCKPSSMVEFNAVDSMHSPGVYAVRVIEGEGARQTCTEQAGRSAMRGPVTLPTLTPPRGATATGGGSSSWSGNSGSVSSQVLTTMTADSVLAHYAGQLVAAGWKREGRTVAADGIAVQRFSFRQDDANWSAALIVFAAGDKRDIRIEFDKVE